MKYEIGTKFMSRGKCPRVCTVIDIYKTYNNAGELVRECYVASHEFVGQTVTDYNVAKTSIARGWLEQIEDNGVGDQ